MSQTETLFHVRAPVSILNATTSAPTPTQLPKAGETLRIVNTGDYAAYIGLGDTSATSVAVLPTVGSLLSCYIGPGADITFSMLGDQQKFVSAITASGTATLLLYVGSGS